MERLGLSLVVLGLLTVVACALPFVYLAATRPDPAPNPARGPPTRLALG